MGGEKCYNLGGKSFGKKHANGTRTIFYKKFFENFGFVLALPPWRMSLHTNTIFNYYYFFCGISAA